jgi:hypothetical protein
VLCPPFFPLFQVSATDNGGLSCVTSLVIIVQDVDEFPFVLERPFVRFLNEFPGTFVGDGLKALSQDILSNAPLLALDPEPGAVTITISGGPAASSFSMGATSYSVASKITQALAVVANTSVLNYERLFPEYMLSFDILVLRPVVVMFLQLP